MGSTSRLRSPIDQITHGRWRPCGDLLADAAEDDLFADEDDDGDFFADDDDDDDEQSEKRPHVSSSCNTPCSATSALYIEPTRGSTFFFRRNSI